MANLSRTVAAAALLAACSVACISPASAQWRGPGPAIGLGIAAGVLAGAAIASQPYYYGPGYYPPGYYPPPPPPGDPVGYCMSRFKSYDPASGTYLGYDGLRHPCP
jgi:hypothetical protein